MYFWFIFNWGRNNFVSYVKGNFRYPCIVGIVNLSSALGNSSTFSEGKRNKNKCGNLLFLNRIELID